MAYRRRRLGRRHCYLAQVTCGVEALTRQSSAWSGLRVLPGSERTLRHDLLPAAFAAVRNDAGQVLLVRRIDDGNWELPGGRIEVGETAGTGRPP